MSLLVTLAEFFDQLNENASIQECSELDFGFLSDSLPRRTYSDVTLDRLYGGSRRGNTVVVRHNQIPVSLQTHNLSLLYA